MKKDILLEKMYRNNTTVNLDRLGYHMLDIAFSQEDIHIGLKRALFFAKIFMQASDVILYKKDEYQNYEFYVNGSKAPFDKKWLSIFIKKAKDIIENKKVLYFTCDTMSNDKDIFLMPISVRDQKYIIAVRNPNIYKLYENEMFIERFSRDMKTILGQMNQYDSINLKSHKDGKTGLENRNTYDEDIKRIDNSDEPYIYVLFDLFRLKYINDTYNYQKGDAYIYKTAEILKRYFPKYITHRNQDGSIKKDKTGSIVYRLGGDEFALISKNESLDTIERKIDLIREEVENMDLNVSDKLMLGINYGIATRENNETVQELSLIANGNLKDDKTKMYRKFGIDRRR